MENPFPLLQKLLLRVAIISGIAVGFLAAMLAQDPASDQAPPNYAAQQPLGPSGALLYRNGLYLDINTAVVPRKTSSNEYTGRQAFHFAALIPAAAAPAACDTSGIGNLWLDSRDANNTRVRICLMVAGAPQWSSQ